MRPRAIASALVLVVLAFLAGALLGSQRSPVPPAAVASIPPTLGSGPASPSPAADGSSFTPVGPLLHVSDFAEGFDPASLIAAQPGGKVCTTEETTGPSVPGEVLVRTWLATCPLKGLGANFVPELLRSVINALPDLAGSESGSGASVIADQQFQYADGVFVGTVTVASTERAGSLVLAFTLQEAAASPSGS